MPSCRLSPLMSYTRVSPRSIYDTWLKSKTSAISAIDCTPPPLRFFIHSYLSTLSNPITALISPTCRIFLCYHIRYTMSPYADSWPETSCCCCPSVPPCFLCHVASCVWHVYDTLCANVKKLLTNLRTENILWKALLWGTCVCVSLCFRLIGGSDYKLIYRHYATLYFVFCVDSSESELGILDLIQVLHKLELCFGVHHRFDFAYFYLTFSPFLGICWNTRQMLRECLWAWPYFPRGQGREKPPSLFSSFKCYIIKIP